MKKITYAILVFLSDYYYEIMKLGMTGIGTCFVFDIRGPPLHDEQPTKVQRYDPSWSTFILNHRRCRIKAIHKPTSAQWLS